MEEIYRLNARTVARWAEHLGGPRLDAEEVVQEVFLVVNRRLEEFRGEAKLTTWLFRITSRVVANHRRRLRRRCLWARLTRRVAETTPAPGPAPGDQLELAQAARRFQRVMDGLSDRYREVLVLFELDEMATEQIARLLDRPAGDHPRLAAPGAGAVHRPLAGRAAGGGEIVSRTDDRDPPRWRDTGSGASGLEAEIGAAAQRLASTPGTGRRPAGRASGRSCFSGCPPMTGHGRGAGGCRRCRRCRG